MQTLKGQLEEAAEKREALLDESKAILKVAQEAQSMSEEDAEKVDQLIAQVEGIDRFISKHQTSIGGGFIFGEGEEDAGRQASFDQTAGPIFRDGSGRQIQAYAGTQKMAQASTSGEVGEVIHQHLRNGEPMNVHVGANDSSGGFVINPEFSTRFIDLARSSSVCMRAGAVTLPMQSSELVIAGLASDPTSHWRAETVKVTATDMTFNRLTLRAKTLAAIVPVSIEMIEDASNAPQIIESALQASMGLKLDQAGLTGSGAGQNPKGLQNTDGVNSISAVGTPTSYDKPSSAVGKILQANYTGPVENLAWITNPRDGETFDQLKDTTNQPLMKPEWVSKLRPFSTTSLPTNLGAGDDESLSIIGDFSQLAFGIRKNLTIRILDAGSVTDEAGEEWNAASQLMRFIVAYMRADVAVLRPTWFTNMDGITAA